LFFAMDLPDQWVNPMPAASGFVWDVAGDPVVANGHAVAGAGYNQSGVTIDSWGLLGTLTWKAIAKYCTKASGGGLYVMLTPDELAKGQTKAPNSVANGVDWTALIQDFNSLGANPPIPVPTPTPTPTTAPVITSPKSATATVNKNFSYKISATNNPTGFAASGLPAGFSVNASSGVISGTPKAPGSCKITVSAKNAKGIGSATIALTIVKTPAPTPPPATPPPPSSGTPPPSSGATQFRWVPPPGYTVPPLPPVPQPPLPLPEGAQRAIGALMRSPSLGVVAVVGLVTLGVVGVVALSEGEVKTDRKQ